MENDKIILKIPEKLSFYDRSDLNFYETLKNVKITS